MKHVLICVLLAAIFASPGMAQAVTAEDFQVKTTEDLIRLCTVSANDPLVKESIHFCHGFLVGAYNYYLAQASGPDGDRMVCLPDPPPTRDQAIRMFVEWVKAHPQYLNERPVETEFRFLVEKWPCKP